MEFEGGILVRAECFNVSHSAQGLAVDLLRIYSHLLQEETL